MVGGCDRRFLGTALWVTGDGEALKLKFSLKTGALGPVGLLFDVDLL